MIRALIAAPASGSGKTTVACALLRAWKERGLDPCALKCGPDYIDPMFHRAALGVESHNVDLFLSGPERARELFERACRGHGAVVCEGAMGLYDGLGGTTDRGSAWETARTLDLPIVLVVRARGASLTLAALIRGLCSFREEGRIAGVILDECSAGTAGKLAPVLERETGVPMLGHLPRMEEASFSSRHLGLYTAEEIGDLDARLSVLARALEEGVDMGRLLSLCDDGRGPMPAAPSVPSAAPKARIAVARDEAFCFCYAETLEVLREAGAELVSFSPLRDRALPEGTGGLYLPGGYPELYARELSENVPMRQAVAAAVRDGMPTVAECGGAMYLGEAIRDASGERLPMAGALPGESADTGHLVRFGYGTVCAERDSLLFRAGERIPVHEFHYWENTVAGEDLRMEKGDASWRFGTATETMYAGFPHLYLAGRPELAERLVEAAGTYGRRAMELRETVGRIGGPDEAARAEAKARWDRCAKPLGSLGVLEEMISDIAALTGSAEVDLSEKAVLVLCADHGVTVRGVAQTGSEVTGIVARELAAGRTSVCRMARAAGCRVVPVDLGIRGFGPCDGVLSRRVGDGTADFTRGPAMSREQAEQAILTGIDLVREEKERGTRLLAAGEMGIGNTTAASAVVSVLLGLSPEEVTGRGAGLSDEGLERKRWAVRRGIEVDAPDPEDPVGVLAKVGGFELAGMCGVFLGGAAYRIPVLIDGFPSAAAALCALRLCPAAGMAMLAGHVSAEPAARAVLEALGKRAPIAAGMRLGEGTGAVAAMPLLDLALAVYREAYTFEEGGIEPYTPQEKET